jgi:ferrous iron transport protein B
MKHDKSRWTGCENMSTTTPTILKTHHLIAVVGNPNCGKTTLFNALTGLRQKVGNYPGVTVEKREGVLTSDPAIRILDLPGTYSLSARSLDEQIARDALLGRLADTTMPDGVLIVIDVTNLERNLYLATQVIDLGLPAVVACNMMDLLRQGGHQLDVQQLSASLGVPVVPTVGHHGEGLDELRGALRQLCLAGRFKRKRQWQVAPNLEQEIAWWPRPSGPAVWPKNRPRKGPRSCCLAKTIK